MSMGGRIRERRERRGFNRAELARRVGVSKTTVTNWEEGIQQDMLASKLLRLSKELQCTVDWLLSGHGEPGDEITLDPVERNVVLNLRALTGKQRDHYVRTLESTKQDNEALLAELRDNSS